MFVKICQQIFDSSIASNTNARGMFIDTLIRGVLDGLADITDKAIPPRRGRA
jgi:hypothetical protein